MGDEGDVSEVEDGSVAETILLSPFIVSFILVCGISFSEEEEMEDEGTTLAEIGGVAGSLDTELGDGIMVGGVSGC